MPNLNPDFLQCQCQKLKKNVILQAQEIVILVHILIFWFKKYDESNIVYLNLGCGFHKDPQKSF